VLRGKNKRADALANQAMDRGTGKTVKEIGGRGEASRAPSQQPLARLAASSPQPANAAEKRTLKGFVKNGVVHLLEGELPENCFVRVTPE
jgi:probable phosphoglycerate mutase